MKEPVRIVTVAVSGKPVSASLADFGRDMAPHCDPKARYNVIAFHGGDNDIAQGRSAAQAYDSLSRYVTTAHAQGWKVVVSTELAHPDWTAAGAVVDYASVPGMSGVLGRESSGFFSADRIHPSGKGSALLADLLQRAIATITSPV